MIFYNRQMDKGLYYIAKIIIYNIDNQFNFLIKNKLQQ